MKYEYAKISQAELDELKAAAQREERAAKRAAKGIVDTPEEKPASQVGNRRYARGRAYVPDRFTNPEGAAAAPAAAAAESANAESLDETVDEENGAMTAPETEAVPETGTAPEAEEAAEDWPEVDYDFDGNGDADDEEEKER